MQQDFMRETLKRSLVEFDLCALNFYNDLLDSNHCSMAERKGMDYVKSLANSCQYQILCQPAPVAAKSCGIMIQEATNILNYFVDTDPGTDFAFAALELNKLLTRVSALASKYGESFNESPEITDCINGLEKLALNQND